ncbi:MAG: uroporphyrinogen decarboxylase family protein, partial [Armatimonadota bacterium]|nr:uroporphyrinogen decarboxylase family protein [Armatimonadota bacterium]
LPHRERKERHVLSSRERILRSIAGEEVDHVPFCQLLFSGLRQRCAGERDFARRQLEAGMDVVVDLGAPPLRLAPEVRVECRKEGASPHPLLHKTYRTPAGDLHTVVEQTPDWPHGDDIPLFSDYLIPRARKFLVCEEKDLEPLQFLLMPPTAEAVALYRERARQRAAFAAAHGLATRAGFSRLPDTLCWLCGCEAFATWGITRPRLFGRLVERVARTQEAQIAAALEARPHLLIDPQWYGTPFLSPSLYREFLARPLCRRVEMAHCAGARFCAIATANVHPFAALFRDVQMDALFGVDPLEGGWNLPRAKQELGSHICLWGGVNAYLSVVHATPAETRAAVRYAMESLAPGGRFILAAVDDIRIENHQRSPAWPAVWENVMAMVDQWRRLSGQRIPARDAHPEP